MSRIFDFVKNIFLIFKSLFRYWLKFNEPLDSYVAEYKDLPKLKISSTFLLDAFIEQELLSMSLSHFISQAKYYFIFHINDLPYLLSFVRCIFAYHFKNLTYEKIFYLVVSKVRYFSVGASSLFNNAFI